MPYGLDCKVSPQYNSSVLIGACLALVGVMRKKVSPGSSGRAPLPGRSILLVGPELPPPSNNFFEQVGSSL